MNPEEKKIMGLATTSHSLVHLYEGVLPPLLPLGHGGVWYGLFYHGDNRLGIFLCLWARIPAGRNPGRQDRTPPPGQPLSFRCRHSRRPCSAGRVPAVLRHRHGTDGCLLQHLSPCSQHIDLPGHQGKGHRLRHQRYRRQHRRGRGAGFVGLDRHVAGMADAACFFRPDRHRPWILFPDPAQTSDDSEREHTTNGPPNRSRKEDLRPLPYFISSCRPPPWDCPTRAS